MSILPIVKFCNKRNFLSLFTRVNHYKHDTIFRLNTIKKSKKTLTDSIYVGKNKYSFDTFGVYMHNSKQPTCKIIGRDIIALNNIKPNTELTYDQALHEKEQREKEQREKEQTKKKVERFFGGYGLTKKKKNKKKPYIYFL